MKSELYEGLFSVMVLLSIISLLLVICLTIKELCKTEQDEQFDRWMERMRKESAEQVRKMSNVELLNFEPSKKE